MNGTMGGSRLVAAMEHVDRVVGAFLEDVGRAVAQVRAEVTAERDGALSVVTRAQADLAAGLAQLAAEREDFEKHRERQEAELEARWTELRREQEREKEERTTAEREIREMSQRATAETQAAALLQMQAAQASQAAQYGLALPSAASGYTTLGGAMTTPAMGLGAGMDGAHPSIITPLPSGMVGFPDPMQMGGIGGASLGGGLGGSGGGGAPLQGASAAQLIFAVGGLQRANSPLWTAEVYEAEHGAWRQLPEMSTARGYLGVAHGGRGTTLLAMGGSDGTSTLSSVEEFNYGAGVWRHVAPMSRPRIWLAAATLGDNTFAVGGYDGAEYLDLVEMYTPGLEGAKQGSAAAAGRWDACRSLSNGRSTMGLAACQGTLYAVGGFAAPHYLSTVEAYDPNANQW